MSENKVMLATKAMEIMETTRSIHDDYEATLYNLATACYELSKEKANQGLFFTYRVETKENPYGIYLKGFEKDSVRYGYICNTCHHFLHTYGNAVYINEDGTLESIIWNPDVAVGYMKPIIKALKDNVEKDSNIINFMKIDPNTKSDVIRKDAMSVVFGDKTKGGYNHFYGEFFNPKIGGSYLTGDNIDFRSTVNNLKNILGMFSKDNVSTAFAIASSNLLGDARRVTKKIGVLLTIYEDVASIKNANLKHNKIVKYACEYYSMLHGFIGSVEGELLQDVSAGYTPEECAARYNYKIDPVRYKRPTAAPTKALVKEAESIIANMGLEDSLKRRIAKLSDIPEDKFIWKPEEKIDETRPTSIFSNVTTKEDLEYKKGPVLDLTRADQRITFAKFKRDVLPKAVAMRVYIPNSLYPVIRTIDPVRYPFTQYTTEAIKGSKPIIKYDSSDPDNRNPFVAYMYHGGSDKKSFGMGYTKDYADVVAIIPHPEAMAENPEDVITGAVFVLKGCKDCVMNGGLGLFPECLIPELYPIRKVIESFSNKGKLEDITDGSQSAAGIMLLENYSLTVEVKTCNDTLEKYTIDRLE